MNWNSVRITFILTFFALCFACYTPPRIERVNTDQTQKQADVSAQELARLRSEMTPDAPNMSPQDRAVIITAENSLRSCAAELRRITDQQNTCAKAEAECADRYKDKTAELAALKDEFSWWGRFKAAWHWVGVGAILGAVLAILGPLLIRIGIKAATGGL